MRKYNFPPSVKSCFWYWDKQKLVSNPPSPSYIIFNILNYGTDEAAIWLQEHFTEKEIRTAIKKSYASAWKKGSLKLWADFYKVCPEYRHKMEDVLKNDPEKDKLLATIDDNWSPYGGHTIWEEIKKYQELKSYRL